MAGETLEEVPKVLQEKRRRDRAHFVGALMLLAVVCGCTYYIVSKLQLSPF
jgi:hypothetical protein